MPDNLHILGIRHHGPGSAQSVLRALDELKPDCVLIEGPPDADEMIPFAAREEMHPPVAILVHDVAEPSDAVYYPFAAFSPEWQAIRWALANNVAVRFMDLPQSHRLAIDANRRKALLDQLKAIAEKKAADEAAGKISGDDDVDAAGDDVGDADTDSDEAEDAAAAALLLAGRRIERDPLQRLAEAAGFDDGERWWEHVVEHRREEGVALFAAIRDAMAELRKDRDAATAAVGAHGRVPAAGETASDTDNADAGGDARAPGTPISPRDEDELLREAWMRQTIRDAIKGGAKNIAVVCGAWHAPVLDVEKFTKKADADLLKGLPKTKTAATWIPWTYDRLTFASGYGAGVHSPGWYDHLWRRKDSILEAWMSRVAGLLREKDIDCSSAHVIEAVRLSETLATIRGRPLADLSDIADATRSIFCFDSDVVMRLIDRELLVGHRIGQVPEDTPTVPLQQDLMREQKRLRLKAEALEKELDLDLRGDTDRERSILLHRLRLLGIDWGTPHEHGRGKGTFHELWQLRWQPEYAVKLIEAGTLGTTIEQAAGAAVAKAAADTNDLRSLAARLQDAMLASLGDAATALVKQIENVAAVATDITLLMETLPSLTSLLRYGNVRKTDEGMVREIVDGIVPRITVGLGGAVGSLNDDAAAAMDGHLKSTNAALEQLDAADHTADWQTALNRILGQDTVHGLVRGRAARLLLDGGKLSTDDVGLRLSQTLSRGSDPGQAARWLEGFLSGSGLLLIHDPKLLGLIDAWVRQINPDIFDELLPLLRRTFTTFPAPERRQIGQMIGKGKAASGSSRGVALQGDLNHERAARALPLLLTILKEGV
ncbi:DUF5682 family protein [Humisphaera borealis]|uniref:Uncharacterized protein n=1 Tax=Humisphaera borealis TaxID=2807512 RepID=A0A7M2WPD7_9BACT|nr:DUF5682 family protein [Humisphaera borealis]QOV87326.1 hypothetical protein IPV69_13600 [Humisphaera borealis]